LKTLLKLVVAIVRIEKERPGKVGSRTRDLVGSAFYVSPECRIDPQEVERGGK
jgi:hypothetical protein